MNDGQREDVLRAAALRGEAGREAFEDAWDEAYFRFSPRLHALLIGRGFDADERDDIVARTWMRAFEKIGQYSGRGAFGAWLAAIAARVASNLVRTERSRAQAGAMIAQTTMQPEGEEARLLERVDVAQRLGEVTPRERALIRLWAAGHSHREIVERLALPSERASEQLLSRALRKLRTMGVESAAHDLTDGRAPALDGRDGDR